MYGGSSCTSFIKSGKIQTDDWSLVVLASFLPHLLILILIKSMEETYTHTLHLFSYWPAPRTGKGNRSTRTGPFRGALSCQPLMRKPKEKTSACSPPPGPANNKHVTTSLLLFTSHKGDVSSMQKQTND